MAFEFMIFIRISKALLPILSQLFVPLLFFDNLYVHQIRLYSYSLRCLVSRSKLIFFTFESAETYRILYIKDALFSCKILLKLIHFKSRNSGVTWSRNSGVTWPRNSGVTWSRNSGVTWLRNRGVTWSRNSGVT